MYLLCSILLMILGGIMINHGMKKISENILKFPDGQDYIFFGVGLFLIGMIVSLYATAPLIDKLAILIR